jgi:mannose-6-phosphate isomerase-like protein (cupin superfamily)
MNIFCENINDKSIENENYRKVAFTGKHLQFVYMSIKPKDNIHLEVHNKTDQFIRIEKGYGLAIIDGKEYKLYDNIGIIIPSGCHHEIINSSNTEELKLYTIYAPPEHPNNEIDITNPNKINREIKVFRM